MVMALAPRFFVVPDLPGHRQSTEVSCIKGLIRFYVDRFQGQHQLAGMLT